MNTHGSVTVKGYIVSVPRAADSKQASVAIMQDDVEFRVIPRGAGVDLDDNVSMNVEVQGTVETVDEMNYLHVRGYTLLDDDSWLED